MKQKYEKYLDIFNKYKKLNQANESIKYLDFLLKKQIPYNDRDLNKKIKDFYQDYDDIREAISNEGYTELVVSFDSIKEKHKAQSLSVNDLSNLSEQINTSIKKLIADTEINIDCLYHLNIKDTENIEERIKCLGIIKHIYIKIDDDIPNLSCLPDILDDIDEKDFVNKIEKSIDYVEQTLNQCISEYQDTKSLVVINEHKTNPQIKIKLDIDAVIPYDRCMLKMLNCHGKGKISAPMFKGDQMKASSPTPTFINIGNSHKSYNMWLKTKMKDNLTLTIEDYEKLPEHITDMYSYEEVTSNSFHADYLLEQLYQEDSFGIITEDHSITESFRKFCYKNSKG
jgi:hypothetical protein